MPEYPDAASLEQDIFDPADAGESENMPLTEYDLISTPNDFNVMTIKNFLETGAVQIPRYQRNFVWDKARSSKLIESLILGLPVPQVFLYEEERNTFQIIDGQQRLMSIYFFLVGRFPRKATKPLLREMWTHKGGIPPEVLNDDTYFEQFKLLLKTPDGAPDNPLDGLNFDTLGDRNVQLSMRPLRNVIIKQVTPAGRGAVYEIFNRLNTTGVNLTPQEIRVSLASSKLMEALFDLNKDTQWRFLLGSAAPDARLKDLEILLRSFAMADPEVKYRPSMVRFLNDYADNTKKFSEEQVSEKIASFTSFLNLSRGWNRGNFLASNRFSVPVFEAVYTGYERARIAGDSAPSLTEEQLIQLVQDADFVAASTNKTTDTRNVEKRKDIAALAFSVK